MRKDWRELWKAHLVQESEKKKDIERLVNLNLQKEHARKVAENKKKFRCHICHRPSNGPVFHAGWENPYDRAESWPDHYDYDQPTGLKNCCRCGKWTCEEHITEDGVCQRCVEKELGL